jgi:MerR family transcriptional regulator, mercuric resistance operon regulatory protein
MDIMTIGTLAASSGVKVTTIRFYERTGLMPAPARSAGRHRHYTDDHLRRLRFICRARELKFSIREVRALLVLADPARDSCGEVQTLAAAHLNKLRQEVAALVRLEVTLSRAVERCSGNTIAPCPVLQLLQSAD